jgi:hypothetical protein
LDHIALATPYGRGGWPKSARRDRFAFAEERVMDSTFTIPVWLALVIAIACVMGWKVAQAYHRDDWMAAVLWLALGVIASLVVALVCAWGWL